MYNLDIPAGKYANGDIFFIQVGFYTREAAENYANRVIDVIAHRFSENTTITKAREFVAKHLEIWED